MDKKTISISAIAALIGSMLMLGGVSLYDDNVYYCQANNVVMQCDKISTYYSLDNGKCWNSEVGNKLCRSGWLLIEKDFEVNPVASLGEQYECFIDGCVEI